MSEHTQPWWFDPGHPVTAFSTAANTAYIGSGTMPDYWMGEPIEVTCKGDSQRTFIGHRRAPHISAAYNCAYCGGYVEPFRGQCPHCGAPRKVDD